MRADQMAGAAHVVRGVVVIDQPRKNDRVGHRQVDGVHAGHHEIGEHPGGFQAFQEIVVEVVADDGPADADLILIFRVDGNAIPSAGQLLQHEAGAELALNVLPDRAP